MLEGFKLIPKLNKPLFKTDGSGKLSFFEDAFLPFKIPHYFGSKIISDRFAGLNIRVLSI
jgi:hypothetical protein